MPTSDSCTAAIIILFDHLVGAGEQRWRHGEAERLGGFEIDWHPVSWLRRADRSSISSFHLADSAGKLSILRYSVSVFSCCEWDHVKPSPRSHRRSLTQGGERRWRRDGGHPFGEPERAFVRHGRGPSARRLDRGRELPRRYERAYWRARSPACCDGAAWMPAQSTATDRASPYPAAAPG